MKRDTVVKPLVFDSSESTVSASSDEIMEKMQRNDVNTPPNQIPKTQCNNSMSATPQSTGRAPVCMLKFKKK